MIDIHCHLLPGIDDGPVDWPESLSLAELCEKAGIEKVIATPHFIPGIYEWGLEEGMNLQQTLIEALQRNGVALETFLAAEVGLFPELPDWIQAGKVPLMPTGRHILLETPLYGGESLIKDMMYAVLSIGITPIFAHPERNPVFIKVDLARDIVASEGELQLDAGSLITKWGPDLKRVSMALIDNGLVKYVASDSHGPGKRDPGELAKVAETVEDIWGAEARRALFHDNPLELTFATPSM